MAPVCFKGSVEELKNRMTTVSGEWTEDGIGKYTFRATNGAILNFWPKRGTIQFQGKREAIPELEALFSDTQLVGVKPKVFTSHQSTVQVNRTIFIVHGHDTEARDQLELALHRLGMQPFILMNSAAQGKTLIESLEGHIGKDYSSAFGIVLMTPDDVGYSKKEGSEKSEPRARQNVVLETGMLLSSLTRKRMALIVKGHLELPSDLEGIIRLGYNDHIREIIPKLCQNLKEAGFDITSEAITAASY